MIQRNLSRYLMGLLLALFASTNLLAADLTIVSGGGYKKPIQAVIHAYHQKTDQVVEAGYGNMRQILSQTEASSKIALIIGDRRFLSQSKQATQFQTLGKGQLVIAWAKGSPAIGNAQDLTQSAISRIAYPHAKKAIYGRAATEWLKTQQLTNPLQEKLMQVATVPQVSSYLVAREIDAGFINLTDAIGLGDKIGGYLALTEGYEPIEIVAAQVTGRELKKSTQDFLTFLASDEARKIFKQYGM